MAKLFEKRMNLAKNVALYKKKYSLPIEDLEREQQLLNKWSFIFHAPSMFSSNLEEELPIKFTENLGEFCGFL